MQIDSKQFLNDGYAIIPECIPPDMLDQLRESFATLVERQKAIWAREAQPDDPPGGVRETSGQPRIERKNKRLSAALTLMAVACALFVNPTIPPLSLKTRRRIPLGKGFNR